MRKKIIVLIISILSILLFITNNVLLAQQHRQQHRRAQAPSTFSIKGKVTDSNNIPVANATVLIPEIGISVKTDASGTFELKQIPKGKYHLEVIKNGYMPYRSDFFVLKNKELTFEFVLIREIREEIVVTATRRAAPIKEVPIRTEVITARAIEESGAKTVSEVLNKELLGCWVNVSCTNCNFSELRMQGLEGGYSQVLVDGLPIFSGLASVYGLQQMRSENIEQIEILKGASSSLYGAQAIGGVVNIITREPSLDPEFSFDGTYGKFNTFDLATRGSYRKGIFGIVATAQKAKNDYVDENNDNFTDKIESDNLNLSIKTNFYLQGDMHRISLFGRYIDEFRRGGYIPNLDDPLDENGEHISTDRYEYGLSYQGIFKETNIFKFSLVGTKHKRHATNSARPFDSDEKLYVIDVQYSHQLFDSKHTITSGITYKDEKINEVINYDPAPEKGAKTTGVYMQDEIKALENLDLVLGLRYDYTESTFIKASSVSPRAGARWEISPEFSLRASIGSGFRVPYLFAEDLHLCSAAPLIYNPGTLEPEKSLSYSINAEYYTHNLFFDFNIFRTLIKKKIFFSEENAPPGFDFVYLNGGDAYTQGIEASANIQLLHHLRLKSGIAFTDAQYKEEQYYGIGKSRHIMRTPVATALLNLEYNNFTKGLTVNLIGRMTGRMYLENYVEERIDKTPSYTLWDFNIIKKFAKDHILVSFVIDNIFNYTQKKIYTALEDESAAYIYAPMVGRYISINIGLRY
ncbi:MAG: TonB-dependent receptor [Candidatus Aminicenantes bacterium]|nr:TonB-dependent receptor [Candidatus Aminicenantes bacterium]